MSYFQTGQAVCAAVYRRPAGKTVDTPEIRYVTQCSLVRSQLGIRTG